jgi:hypothetical protein
VPVVKRAWQMRCSHRYGSLTPSQAGSRAELYGVIGLAGALLEVHGRAFAAGETGNSASSVQGWQRRWTRHGGQTTSSRSMGDLSAGPMIGRTDGRGPRQDCCICELHYAAAVGTMVLGIVAMGMVVSTAKTGYRLDRVVVFVVVDSLLPPR